MRNLQLLSTSSILLMAAGACTTLGPTPATTGLSARPMDRDGLEAQVGLVPGHHLSASVVASPEGTSVEQVSAAAQVDEWLGLPGLVLAVRRFGRDGDTPIEPVLGYRRAFGDGAGALAGFVYGGRAGHEERGASYRVRRLGAELAGDLRLAPSRWVEPHVFGGFNLHDLDARGAFCTDADGQWGRDCSTPPDPPSPVMETEVRGRFVAAHVGVAAELLRHRHGWFQGGRVAFTAAGGTMPHVEAGARTRDEAYFSFGLTLAVAVGASP